MKETFDTETQLFIGTVMSDDERYRTVETAIGESPPESDSIINTNAESAEDVIEEISVEMVENAEATDEVDSAENASMCYEVSNYQDYTDFTITAVYQDMETNDISYQIEFCVGASDPIAIIVDDGSNVLRTMKKKGYAHLTRNQEDTFNEAFSQQKTIMKPIMTYSNIGWRCLNNSTQVFCGPVIVGNKECKSQYNGSFDILPSKPCNKWKELKQDFNKVILPHTPALFGFVAGLSASVVGYISCAKNYPMTLVVNIVGVTSSGKSTIGNLAVSTGCNPFPTICGEPKESLSRTMNSTKNAMYAVLNSNTGYPVLFDELGCKDSELDLVNLIYSFSSGKQRARCDKNGKIQKAGRWATTILLTAEHSFLDEYATPDGISVRVLNMEGVSWTKDANHANRIDDFSKKYYGVAILKLAKVLCKKDAAAMVERYDRLCDEIAQEIVTVKGREHRCAKQIAVIVLTAELLNEIMGNALNLIEFKRFIIQHFDSSVSAAQDEHFLQFCYNKIKEKHSYMILYKDGHRLLGNKPDELNSRNCIGMLDYRSIQSDSRQDLYVTDYYILKNVLEQWACEFQVNHRSMLRQWKKKGWLKGENDRLSTRVRFYDGGTLQTCYHIVADTAPCQLHDAIVTSAQKQNDGKTMEDMVTELIHVTAKKSFSNYIKNKRNMDASVTVSENEIIDAINDHIAKRGVKSFFSCFIRISVCIEQIIQQCILPNKPRENSETEIDVEKLAMMLEYGDYD